MAALGFAVSPEDACVGPDSAEAQQQQQSVAPKELLGWAHRARGGRVRGCHTQKATGASVLRPGQTSGTEDAAISRSKLR